MPSLSLGLVLGFGLGIRHALEPDHLAAVSTLVEARSRKSSVILGAYWGLGHTAALLIVGCVLGALDARLPASLSDAFEILVALMLVVLGVRAIRRARVLGSSGPVSSHRHLIREHAHAGGPAHVHVGPWTLAWRPLLVGLVHGLAGSGALAALVMAELPTLQTRVTYTVLFGFGSLVGMAFLTGIVGWPLARLGQRARIAQAMALVTGAISVGLGGWWGWAATLSLLRA